MGSSRIIHIKESRSSVPPSSLRASSRQQQNNIYIYTPSSHTTPAEGASRKERKTEMKVSFFASVFFFVAVVLLCFAGRHRGDDGDGGGGAEGGLSPATPSSSVPCAPEVGFGAHPIPFNTSSLSCNDAWSAQGFVLMYKQSGPSLWSFILSAPDNNAYIAVGFSPGGRMVGASAVAGWVSAAGAGAVKQYSLGGYSVSQCPPDQGSLKLAPGSTIVSRSSKLYLAFQLSTASPGRDLIFAVGPRGSLPGSDGYLPRHQTMTSTSIDYATGQNSPSAPETRTSPTPSSSSSSSPASCSASLNIDTKLLKFDTSSLRCYTAWSSQDFVLMYKQSGPSLWSFILSAPDNNAYISIGFSPDGRMQGSSAVAGWIAGSGGPGTVKQYSLRGYSSSSCPPDQGSLNLVPGTSTIVSQSSRLYLAFQLNTTQPQTHLLYAVGPAGNLPPANYYLPTHQDKTSTTLNYATGESSTLGGSTTTLKRVHGILGMAAWGILVPVGVAIARYGKHWDPFWFYAHLSVQGTGFVLAVICTVAGFIVENRVGVDVGTHKALGIFILVLGCLQVMAVMARPEKGSKIRRYWNWYHHYVGRAAIICAIANIFYGFSLAKESGSWSTGFGIALGILLAAGLVLEARLWLTK